MRHIGFESFKVRCRLRPEKYNFIMLIFVSFVYAFAKFTCNASLLVVGMDEHKNETIFERQKTTYSKRSAHFDIPVKIWESAYERE